MAGPITIHYHRDFDGMVSAGVLANILREIHGERVQWRSVNYDQRRDWANFQRGHRFAIVDFHFHPKAAYWFDHHPTTFLSPEDEAKYAPSEKWAFDPESPSCPPIILAHAEKYWDYKTPERFRDMAHWSNVIDAAKFESVDEALFGDDPALRISRCMTVAPTVDWPDRIVGDMVDLRLEDIAMRPDVEKAWQRAVRNRDKALDHFPGTVQWVEDRVMLYDASSNKIRRERFAPFFHHPEIHYAVGVIPTRSGFHVTAGVNPWNPPSETVHIGEIMQTWGGGGHRAVGGVNPGGHDKAIEVSELVAAIVREKMAAL
ncbi:MAG: hypothetical protein P8N31_09515 [Planctomycetota bacterium]|nr:hypothetical protein [Planctomycetota bacterium]MDG2143781.1 hypothetical protein [Planctomycetota bacterium]